MARQKRPKHGGARPGSGRKSSDAPKRPLGRAKLSEGQRLTKASAEVGIADEVELPAGDVEPVLTPDVVSEPDPKPVRKRGRPARPKSEAPAAVVAPARVYLRTARFTDAEIDPVSSTKITDMARSMAARALRTLLFLAERAVDEKVRESAADKILLRAYGKPLGIGSQFARPEAAASPDTAVPAAAVEKPAPVEKLGKKEALLRAAENPDESTAMGRLIAERNAKIKMN